MRLTLGFSPCPNDTFMVDALVNGRIDTFDLQFEPVIADVEVLNKWALAGKLDVTKLSFNAFFQSEETYTLLQAGAALGRGCGPLVIARRDLTEDEMVTAKVALPGENTTAHLLFSLKYPVTGEKKFMIFSEVEGEVLDSRVDAGVIIHENRFTYKQRGLVKVVDLGEFWERETGLPIPLGCFVARKTLGTDIIEKIANSLRQSVQYAFDRPDASAPYVKLHAQEMDAAVMQQHIETYVNHYSLDLGEEGHAAISELRRRR